MSQNFYEQQEDRRMCGAAALNMVYRRLGKPATQQEIWKKISKTDELGALAARSYLIAGDAIQRGYAAVTLECKDPWETIVACQQAGVQVILNHRSRMDTWHGHYSVVDSIAGQQVVLHDPQFGPMRIETRDNLLALMKTDARMGAREIGNNILVAISALPPTAAKCATCHQETPEELPCPRCEKMVMLRPLAALSCGRPDCSTRSWAKVFCPFCDAVVLRAEGGASANGSPSGVEFESPADEEDRGKKIGAAIFGLQTQLEAMRETMPEEIRQAFGDLVAERGKIVGKLRDALPKLADEMKQTVAKLRESVDEYERESAQQPPPRTASPSAKLAQAHLEAAKTSKAASAAKAAVISVPAATAPAIDLGPTLRELLLRELSAQKPDTAPASTATPHVHSFETWTKDSLVDVAADDRKAADTATNVPAAATPGNQVSSFESWFNAGTQPPAKNLPDGTSAKPPEEQWKEWLQRARPSSNK